MNAPAHIKAPLAKRTTLGEIAHAAAYLDEVAARNLRPLNPILLWAEWHLAKAMHDHFGNDATEDAFQCACDNLGVDHDGKPLAGEAA